MNHIEVSVLQESAYVGGLANLACYITQHHVANMKELEFRLNDYVYNKTNDKTIKFCQDADHQSVTRHGVFTVAVVGASRRFLAQIRTHHIGIDFTSASLQYQDVSESARFVVPYEVLEKMVDTNSGMPYFDYIKFCNDAQKNYKLMLDYGYDNDTAGYVSCQSLRNVLLITGNAEAWRNVIEKRCCNRNTIETQYVCFKIWSELLKTQYGPAMFGNMKIPCLAGGCNQGKMSCKEPLPGLMTSEDIEKFIDLKWPALKSGVLI